VKIFKFCTWFEQNWNSWKFIFLEKNSIFEKFLCFCENKLTWRKVYVFDKKSILYFWKCSTLEENFSNFVQLFTFFLILQKSENLHVLGKNRRILNLAKKVISIFFSGFWPKLTGDIWWISTKCQNRQNSIFHLEIRPKKIITFSWLIISFLPWKFMVDNNYWFRK